LLDGPVTDGGLGLTPPRMTDGGESGKVRGSTDDKCLEELLPLSPIVEYIEDYREASKLLGTYVEPLRQMATTGDGRARATFKLTRQVTGRITTAEPMNLLSIPVRSELGAQCRYGFIAPDGKIIHDADLSTVEMRTFAHLSRDKRLCEIFIKGHEATGDDKLKWDVHTQSASNMFGVSIPQVEKYQRQAGKVINFFTINGGTAFGLRIQMIKFRAYKKDGSRWSEDDCQDMLDAWYQIYPGARRFQNDCIEETRATGLARDPLSGRIRYLPQIWSPINKVRAEAERCSFAHLIQTSANTILKRAMMAMWDVLRNEPGVEPLLPVHDEVLHEVPDNEETKGLVDSVVAWALTSTTDLIVPIEAEGGFGPNWGEAKH
jgi:DNA polymerase I